MTAGIRKYRSRPINWDAATVEQLISLNVENSDPPMTESPLTIDMSSEEIRSFIEKPFQPPHYECHSQPVERAVKDTTEAVGMVTGRDRQDGLTLYM